MKLLSALLLIATTLCLVAADKDAPKKRELVAPTPLRQLQVPAVIPVAPPSFSVPIGVPVAGGTPVGVPTASSGTGSKMAKKTYRATYRGNPYGGRKKQVRRLHAN